MKKYYLLVSLLVALILFGFPIAAIRAADGDLDPTFGIGGKVLTDFSGSGATIYALAKQADGKIIGAGYSSIGVEEGGGFRFFYDFGLARYNLNGTLDTTFGTNGKVTTHFLEGQNIAAAVVVQSDGKIIAAGSALTYGGKSDVALARYHPDGSLDSSFGSGGKILLDFFGFNDVASALALQQDGKIVIAGSAANGAYIDFAIIRLTSDGSLDSSFGGSGKVITPLRTDNDAASAMVIQADGKIVVGGRAYNHNNFDDFALARYNCDGSLDLSFGTGGTVLTDFLSSFDIGIDVVLQADGKILLAGFVYHGALQFDYGLARYHTDGSLDTSFGNGGKVNTNFFTSPSFVGSQDLAYAIAVLPNGKIVVAGQVIPLFPPAVISLARYTNNGTLDQSFGSGGLVMTKLGFNAAAYSVLLQNDGKLIVGGNSLQSHPDPFAIRDEFAVVRYLNTIFDSCIQDDSSINVLQLNSTTGEYQFTNCSGLTLGGTGILTRRGSTITLQHNANDRRVTATIDTSTNRATASLQVLLQGRTFSIIDRNILNNSCACH